MNLRWANYRDWKTALGGALALLVGGCAATPYQPLAQGQGYFDVSLAAGDTFGVTFVGNAFTRQQRSNDFAMLRAAELVSRAGYSYFQIVESSGLGSSGSVVMAPTVAPTFSSPTNGGGSHTAAMTTGGREGAFASQGAGETSLADYPAVNRHEADLTVTGFRSRPATNGDVYEAASVIKTLRAKYGLN